MKIHSGKTSRIVALSVVSLLLVAGCAPNADLPAVDAIIAFDVSCPTKARMLQYAKAVYGAQRRLPPGSRLRVYLFGHGCDLVYVGAQIVGRDPFNRKIGSSLANPPAHLLASGTQTDRLFETIAGDVAASKSALVLIATDGGMEDKSAEALRRLDLAVQALAKAPGLKAVALIGVEPHFRRQWEGWLKPLGQRACVSGERDADGGIARWLASGGSK